MSRFRLFAFSDEADALLDNQISALIRNGLNGMEIRTVDGKNISEIPVAQAAEIRQKLDSHGLSVWSIGSPIGKIRIDEPFEKHLDLFKHTLDLANVLGAQHIRLFSFYLPKDADPALYRNQVLDRLARFIETANGRETVLCHENEKGIYGDVAQRCLDLHRSLPELKAVFDPANLIQCEEDPLAAWELLQPYVRYLHIKDAKKDGAVVPAGKGDAHMEELLHRAVLHGITAFTLEPHLTVFKGLEALELEDHKTKMEFSYPDANTAFDTACTCFKELLQKEDAPCK